MKRVMSLSILVFMITSLLFSCLHIKDENEVIKSETINLLSHITFKIDTEEIKHLDPYKKVSIEMQGKMEQIENIEDKKEWFLAYKNIVYEYMDWFGLPTTIFDMYSEYEVRLICQVIETETYQCDFESKINVANVVLNRIEHGEFGDSVEEVVTSNKQFAYWRKNITEDTILAAMFAYEIGDTTNGALYFHSNVPTNTFCGRDYIFTDNVGHNFY